jgi:hypothetical protein
MLETHHEIRMIMNVAKSASTRAHLSPAKSKLSGLTTRSNSVRFRAFSKWVESASQATGQRESLLVRPGGSFRLVKVVKV